METGPSVAPTGDFWLLAVGRRSLSLILPLTPWLFRFVGPQTAEVCAGLGHARTPPSSPEGGRGGLLSETPPAQRSPSLEVGGVAKMGQLWPHQQGQQSGAAHGHSEQHQVSRAARGLGVAFGVL